MSTNTNEQTNLLIGGEMAYRNGTYVAFHAEGNADPSQSDMKYYRLLTAWHEHDNIEFKMINSHDKTAAVRDSSLRSTLRERIKERLRNSCNMVLIIGDKTRFDDDWVPEEIAYAVDTCEIPIIAAYPGQSYIQNAANLRAWWPLALAKRIDNGTAKVIHIPFKQEPLKAAIPQFHHDNLPGGSLVRYNDEAYRKWGLLPASAY